MMARGFAIRKLQRKGSDVPARLPCRRHCCGVIWTARSSRQKGGSLGRGALMTLEEAINVPGPKLDAHLGPRHIYMTLRAITMLWHKLGLEMGRSLCREDRSADEKNAPLARNASRHWGSATAGEARFRSGGSGWRRACAPRGSRGRRARAPPPRHPRWCRRPSRRGPLRRSWPC